MKRWWILGLFTASLLLVFHLSIQNAYSINWDFAHIFFGGLYHLRHPVTEEMWKNLPFMEPDPRGMALTPFGPFQTSLPVATYVLFYEKLKWLAFDSAYNIPAVVGGVVGILALYLFLLETTGPLVAMAGFLFLALFPRHFGDLHTNVKDVPTAALYAISIWLFWRLANKRRLRDILLAAAAFAVTFNYKVNAIFIPVIVGLWTATLLFTKARKHLGLPIGKLNVDAFVPFVGYALLAPIFAFIIWGIFWPDPLLHLLYLWRFFQYNTINLEVLFNGQWYCSGVNVPWWYPYGYLAIVTPIPILLFAIVGFLIALRRMTKFDPLAWLLIFWFFVPIVRYMSPKIGVIDGIRHFQEVEYPLVAYAAIGAVGMGAWFLKLRNVPLRIRKITLGIVVVLTLGCLTGNIIRFHPYQLSYFNELVGGLRGAMGKYDIDYWGISQKRAAAWLNENAPADSIVHIVMTGDTAGKYLRPDLRARLNTRDYDSSDFVVVLNRQSFFYRYFWVIEYMLRRKTAFVVENQGVPMTWIYDNRLGVFPRGQEWWHGDSPCIQHYWSSPTP